MKIIVLAGGNSTERDVSLSSGSMIYKALKARGHKAVLLDVYLGYEGELSDIFERDTDWAARVGAIGEVNPDPETLKALRKDGGTRFFGPNVLELCSQADCVFLALHGANGEDGKIQACFELLGIPYTGADAVSSAMAMDKGISKDMFRAYGIPAPAGFRLKKGALEKEPPVFPCVVKACCEGSSVGVSIARNEEEYRAAKEEAFRYGREAIVERYIKGREFSVGILSGKALPVIEMVPKMEFYDYKAKYQAGSAVEICPAPLSREKTEEIQEIAERVFRVLRLQSYARIDFVMSDSEELFCLEANTLPGMTATSLLPQEAAAAGMDFGELCQRILDDAMERYETEGGFSGK